MAKHNITYFTAVADHELGDDLWPQEKVALIQDFERVYTQYMQMPDNRPENKEGLSYYIRHKNVMLITVVTFELTDGEL